MSAARIVRRSMWRRTRRKGEAFQAWTERLRRAVDIAKAFKRKP